MIEANIERWIPIIIHKPTLQSKQMNVVPTGTTHTQPCWAAHISSASPAESGERRKPSIGMTDEATYHFSCYLRRKPSIGMTPPTYHFSCYLPQRAGLTPAKGATKGMAYWSADWVRADTISNMPPMESLSQVCLRGATMHQLTF